MDHDHALRLLEKLPKPMYWIRIIANFIYIWITGPKLGTTPSKKTKIPRLLSVLIIKDEKRSIITRDFTP
jgi:hypothetical protein